MDNSSEEEENEDEEKEEEVDFNNNKKDNLDDLAIITTMKGTENLYEKSNTKGLDKYLKKSNKLGAKLKTKNRLIRSMQNLLSFDRSRSNSADSLSNVDSKLKKNSSKNSIFDESTDSQTKLDSGKSDLFKSLFVSFLFVFYERILLSL